LVEFIFGFFDILGFFVGYLYKSIFIFCFLIVLFCIYFVFFIALLVNSYIFLDIHIF